MGSIDLVPARRFHMIIVWLCCQKINVVSQLVERRVGGRESTLVRFLDDRFAKAKGCSSTEMVDEVEDPKAFKVFKTLCCLSCGQCSRREHHVRRIYKI
jgi:hypothetical protein